MPILAIGGITLENRGGRRAGRPRRRISANGGGAGHPSGGRGISRQVVAARVFGIGVII
jgi:hypothetical protein